MLQNYILHIFFIMHCTSLHALYIVTYWLQYKVAYTEPNTLQFNEQLRDLKVNDNSMFAWNLDFII